MKQLQNILFILFLLLSVQGFAQDDSSEQIIVSLSNPGEPGLLILEHIKGSINVTGYDGQVVIVSASARERTLDSSNESQFDGMKRISSAVIQLTAQEDNNQVTVFSNSHNSTIDMDIKVPRNFSLKLSTYHNGTITVQYVSGEMEISNINGGVIMNEISGSAVVNTIDGDISVRFNEVTPDKPMAFTTIYGKVDIALPSEIKALVKMKTEHGEIFSDFDMTMEKRKAQTERTRREGVQRITLEDWTYGKINGGGPEILLKSFDGNIYIRKRR